MRAPREFQRPPYRHGPSPVKAVFARLSRTIRHAEAIALTNRPRNRFARSGCPPRVRRLPSPRNPVEWRRPARVADISTRPGPCPDRQTLLPRARANAKIARPCQTHPATTVPPSSVVATSIARSRVSQRVAPAADRYSPEAVPNREIAVLVGCFGSIYADAHSWLFFSPGSLPSCSTDTIY